MRDLIEATKVELAEILQAPVVDPEAPGAGFVRREWAEVDTRRRYAEALAVVQRTIATLEAAGGPEIGHAAREHFAPIVALLGGRGMH